MTKRQKKHVTCARQSKKDVHMVESKNPRQIAIASVRKRKQRESRSIPALVIKPNPRLEENSDSHIIGA